METLSERKLSCFVHNEKEIVSQTKAGLIISSKPGHKVKTYLELLDKVSALNFFNPSLQLFFRGQSKDYHNFTAKGKPVRSNLYPSLLRSLAIDKKKRTQQIHERVKKLELADATLKEKLGIGYIHRHRLVRWAILQHYEVCATPLIDLTSSLEVALTFSLASSGSDGYLYVFGFPQQSGSISVSLESMTQIVDLAKISPPEVSRPHFQSAFLAADYPTAMYTDELITRAPRVEANFACRLLTKFHLQDVNNWAGNNFNPVAEEVLFPNKRDKWYPILQEVKTQVSKRM